MSQKTVYFLGAGASAASDFKLPVMKGFFKEEDFPEKGGEYPNLNEFLKTFYKSTDWENFNLEEIITHLELTMEGFSWSPVDSTLYDIKQEVYQYIKFKLDGPVKKDKCSKHLKLFMNINRNDDSVINLNYDLIVDNVLPASFLDDFDVLSGVGNTFTGSSFLPSIPEAKEGVYIKLHGSIDRIYCPSLDCPNSHMFFNCEDSSAGDPCGMCGANLETVIVPPTMKKSFEKFPKLGFLWHVAFNKLKETDKIIVIGMSFPDSDYYLKWLVRQAMMERATPPDLVIVNPDITKPKFLSKYNAIFGVSPAEAHNGLDDYLTHL